MDDLIELLQERRRLGRGLVKAMMLSVGEVDRIVGYLVELRDLRKAVDDAGVGNEIDLILHPLLNR